MAIVGVSIEDFLANGCSCTFGDDKKSCLENFPRNEFIECREKFLELNMKKRTCYFAMNRKPSEPVDKKRIPGYKIYGYNVCKRSFLYLLNISKKKYQNIADHYNQNGLTARQHGNKERLQSNTSSFSTILIMLYRSSNHMHVTTHNHFLDASQTTGQGRTWLFLLL